VWFRGWVVSFANPVDAYTPPQCCVLSVQRLSTSSSSFSSSSSSAPGPRCCGEASRCGAASSSPSPHTNSDELQQPSLAICLYLEKWNLKIRMKFNFLPFAIFFFFFWNYCCFENKTIILSFTLAFFITCLLKSLSQEINKKLSYILMI
jgi:hypothetical protein